MPVPQSSVAIFLSDEVRQVVRSAQIPFETTALLAYVEETDDLGLWIRVDREDGQHVLLIRWEFVLSVDYPLQELRKVGLRA